MSADAAPSSSSLRRDAAENRTRLLDAARIVFAEHGIQAPLELISRQASVGIGTLYRRFATREALLEALFTEEYALYLQAADEALQMADAWMGFEHYVTRICQLQAEHGTIREFLSFSPSSASHLTELHDRLYGRAQLLVLRAKQQGTLRPDADLGDTALIAWANGEIVRITRRVSPPQWRRHLRLMLDGLRVQPRPSELVASPMSSDEILRAIRQNLPDESAAAMEAGSERP